MIFTALVTAAAMASTVAAHTQIFSVWVNGKDQGDGRNVYIRSPPNNKPVKDIDLADIVCNVNGAKPVSDFVSAAAGDKLTFEWYHDNRGDDIIASSHKGPIITWIAPYTEGAGFEPIWSKIDEEGLSGSTWAVDNLIANGGKKDFVLPSALAAGQYLIRQEIIALHESDTTFDVNPARGAQFYPSCVQFEVTGSGSAVPEQNFDFQTGYTYADPGIAFNLYGSFTSYQIPGPEVWTGAGGGSGSPAPTQVTTSAVFGSTTTSVVTPTTKPAAPTTVVLSTSVAAPAPTPLVTSTKVPTTTKVPTPPVVEPVPQPTGGVGIASLYYQCGGKEWTGATACAEGICKAWNEWYSQCIPQ